MKGKIEIILAAQIAALAVLLGSLGDLPQG
jgi:hypothetical protein